MTVSVTVTSATSTLIQLHLKTSFSPCYGDVLETCFCPVDAVLFEDALHSCSHIVERKDTIKKLMLNCYRNESLF